jgi:lysozyme family protein
MIDNFDKIIPIVLKAEVGPQFNCNDAETKAGLCSTKAQRRKTGWNKEAGDTGGATKFGIASNSHPKLNINSITLAQAYQLYRKEYYAPCKCDQMDYSMALVVLDAAVNCGTSRSIKFIQQALSLPVDGKIGPRTLAAVKARDQKELANKLLDIRAAFHTGLTKKRPSTRRFLSGWLTRVEHLRTLIV